MSHSAFNDGPAAPQPQPQVFWDVPALVKGLAMARGTSGCPSPSRTYPLVTVPWTGAHRGVPACPAQAQQRCPGHLLAQVCGHCCYQNIPGTAVRAKRSHCQALDSNSQAREPHGKHRSLLINGQAAMSAINSTWHIPVKSVIISNPSSTTLGTKNY